MRSRHAALVENILKLQILLVGVSPERILISLKLKLHVARSEDPACLASNSQFGFPRLHVCTRQQEMSTSERFRVENGIVGRRIAVVKRFRRDFVPRLVHAHRRTVPM
jgi:hypothetical protein